MTSPIHVAVIGLGWMGAVHSRAYGRLASHFDDCPRPVLTAVADDAPGRARAAAARFGARRHHTDWRELLADNEIDAVSVTVPNFLHREVGCAVLEAGKHLWIEKPVGLSAADATAIADAAAARGLRTAVGFNYRAVPAIQAARTIISAGGIGEITHARVRLFSDYAAHPDGALTWRYQREFGGNGVLGDLASHGADLTRYLLGDIDALVADTATFITQRPEPSAVTSGHQLATGGRPGPVENEDYVSAQLRMASGARCVLEASRVSVGEQNSYGVRIHGTRGMVAWDYRRMGELRLAQGDHYSDAPVATVHVGPGSGAYSAFQPGAANPMSYDDLKVIEAHGFLRSVAGTGSAVATVEDAVAAAKVLDAMTDSVTTGAWVSLRR